MNHRRAIRILLVLVVAVVAAGAAQTEIKGNTNSSVFQNGSAKWQELTFTPGSFDVKPTDFVNGSATIQNLGQFSLNCWWCFENYNHGSFTLKLNFTAPTGVQGDGNWEADLSGQIFAGVDLGVKIGFTQWSNTFNYSNASGSGHFTLTLGGTDSNGSPQFVDGQYVYDLCQAQLAGQITNASFTPSVPEPSAVVLLGTMLIGVAGLMRRKKA